MADRSALVAAGPAGSSGVDVTAGGDTDHVASSDGGTAIIFGASFGDAAVALAAGLVAGAPSAGVLVVDAAGAAVESAVGAGVDSTAFVGGSAARAASAPAGVARVPATSVGAGASASVVELLDGAGAFGTGFGSTVADAAGCALVFADRGTRAREGAAAGTGAVATCGSLCG